MDHPKPGLKYVDASELSGTAARLDGFGSDGGKLGTVEGFIIDVRQHRPLHAVVSAGWFIHKHFLLPIGHVRLSPDDSELRVDITKDRVEGFPGFDKGEFQRLGADQADKLDQMIVAATGAGHLPVLEADDRMPSRWDLGA